VPFTWVFALALLVPPSADGPASSPHVRAATIDARSLIDDATARSMLVREMLARLECTDTIAYVEITASPQIPRARTKLVSASSGARFLRIGLNAGITNSDLVPLLAHELQHAIEIAERDEVRDDAGMRRLFREIGRGAGPDSFETQAALAMEQAVRVELRQRAR
jgi:hypothetical protein